MGNEPMDEVGCRKCGEGGGWRIYTDGKGKFRAIHSCGHVSCFEVVRKPDNKPIEIRFFH